MKLKEYQRTALGELKGFLEATRTKEIDDAYKQKLEDQKRFNEPYHALFGTTPAVCLRVPTGGGKTIMASHAIAIAGKAIKDSDSPVALWLTPSDTIRTQTLAALANVRHPYRVALAEYFGDRVQVCDLESLQTISPHDVGKAAIVIVATIQSLNISDTSKRNVYSFFEELAPHFDGLPDNATSGMEKVSEADLEAQPYLTKRDVGRVKYSVANWLHLQNPIVIVDEAHNNRTDRFFKSIGRLNPCCIIELTATPVVGNNVLYHVGAQELKAEQMIKLPIVLAEHPTGWQDCIRDSIITRARLEVLAQSETQYIRPIILFQAMPKGGEATVDVVKKHLMEEEGIAEEQIAIATGSQKELTGVDLFDPATPIRFVITVEALKEGWDCSFAYVLSSLQTVNSSKDVEQLLGRVLRMPYASEREVPELNKAYAHIVSENFASAASQLRDRMVQNMGFDRLETASLIVPKITENKDGQKSIKLPDCQIDLPQAPNTEHWPAEVKAAVKIHETSQGATLLIDGNTSSDVIAQVETFVVNTLPAKDRAKAKEQFDDHRAVTRAMQSPAERGATFSSIPQLCIDFDGHLEVVEKETLSHLGEWSLLDQKIQLEGFSISESVNSFEIDVKGETVKFKMIDTRQLHLDDGEGHVSEKELIRWLDAETRQSDIGQAQLQAYLVKLLAHLVNDRRFNLLALVRARFQLAQAIGSEIARLRSTAMEKGFQARLFEMVVPPAEASQHYSFNFQPGQYPARNHYSGSYEFSKHFYPVIHELHEKTKDGRPAEEFLCAQAIDAHKSVKHWVRNIERQPKFSFWLPTSTDYFYPDFVAELNDGRFLVVEYKGENLKTNDDSREKDQIGHQWEKASGGRCLFLMAVAKDDEGRNVFKQIEAKLR